MNALKNDLMIQNLKSIYKEKDTYNGKFLKNI